VRLLRISLYKVYNIIHIICSYLQMELKYGKALIKWVNVLSMIHIELISIMCGFQADTKNS
jgi:hypothetical protein